MAMVETHKFGVPGNADQAEEAQRLILPDPGDIIMAMIFGWALFCFTLVIGGKRILSRIARLARNSELKAAIASGDEAALTLLMVSGSLLIIALVIVSFLLCYLGCRLLAEHGFLFITLQWLLNTFVLLSLQLLLVYSC